jgi:hypothetical protein
MTYIIEITVDTLNKKTGQISIYTHYFHYNLKGANVFGDKADAKKYDFKTEADRERKKYFRDRKNVKTVKL